MMGYHTHIKQKSNESDQITAKFEDMAQKRSLIWTGSCLALTKVLNPSVGMSRVGLV